MSIQINKKFLAAALAIVLAVGAPGPGPAGAGLEELVTDGAYTLPAARPVAAVKQPAALAGSLPMEYRVRPGDTLWSIAGRCGLTVAELATANNINEAEILAVGRTLTIPGREVCYHLVAGGETLSHIAGQYGISLDELVKANHLANPHLIRQGDRLIIPVSGQPATALAGQAGKIQLGGWAWPVAGEITSSFGIRGDRPHEGIDIGAGAGATITAPERGRVVWAGPRGTYGLTVILDHGGGIRSLYAHCAKLLVQEGQTVERRQPIAEVGSTGRSTGPHLHMEILRQGIPLDPLMFLTDKLFV
ncbi:peptidoglycan DD-metalloendopeptidase family protein [Desulforamulus hydrothermalis]|uniref:Peptidase M23B n=1 Tax=Desulforamulus hydrothermalis Lam5 = DSM 18033 TaxID=1121428 RepID=K8EA09_9FIRM|nr:M23 family metallopeptidase [Desulforamulus hydrothermalis]CCO08413.1 Peptidase M23B [Desulforamulus hydrothermalis Lam5 = DSM 18033]SHH14887.1 Murein DD-endopeptidase MepM and murein hydrolase activator NlpD, contain LysM domain [Desulforamulus hydrothermalis Lam5 = DSM 18033]